MPLDEASPTSTSSSATNEHFECYWFPHTDRMLTKRTTAPDRRRGRCRGRRRSSTTSCCPTPSSARSPGWAAAEPATVPRINRVATRALPRAPTSTPPTASSRPSRRVASGRWSTPCPRATGMRPSPRLPRAHRAAGWRVGFPVEIRPARPTTSGCPRRYGPRLGLPRLPRPRAHRPPRRTSPGSRQVWAYGGRPHWGKLHTRDRRRCARLSPLRRVRRAARPARPGPAVHQRLPRPGARRRRRSTSDARRTPRHAARASRATSREQPQAEADRHRRGAPPRHSGWPHALAASTATAAHRPAPGWRRARREKTTGTRPASRSRAMPPPMPVTIPISAAGHRAEPVLERPSVRRSRRTAPARTRRRRSTTRSSRPSVGWKHERDQPGCRPARAGSASRPVPQAVSRR